MKRTVPLQVFVCLSLLSLIGCATHYAITEPISGKNYYTDDIDKEEDGSIKFKDAKSGKEVILNSSEIKSISTEDFNISVYGRTDD